MSGLDDVVDSIHSMIHELTDADGLMVQLRDLVAEKSVVARETDIHSGKPGSRPPWDGRAASAYLAIHAAARDLESELHTYVHGTFWRRLAGSDGHTRAALDAVALFVEHRNVPEDVVRQVARTLGSLVHMAASHPAIDTAPPPASSLSSACPSCGAGELEASTATGAVSCLDCARTWARHQWPALLAELAGR